MGDRTGAGADHRPGVVTLEAVAARAGVGRGTASRALNGTGHVSAAARAAVIAAAAELSYVPNAAARSLVRRRADAVAFVVNEEADRFFDDPFFAGVLRGAQAELRRRGLALVFSVVGQPEDRDQLLRLAVSGHVDGVLYLSVHEEDDLLHRLVAARVPVVVSGRPPAAAVAPPDAASAGAAGAAHHAGGAPPRVAHVDADNAGGGRAAAEELLRSGRRRLATITGPLDMPAAVDRLRGFSEALADAGLPLDERLRASGGFTLEGGREAMADLLEREAGLDGVFAASDLMAVGALQALGAAGRRVPQDVAVVGFDDVGPAATCSPPLTTVRQPLEETGRRMARLLLGLLDGEDAVRSVVLPTHLVRRRST